ncbi:MAG: HAMP domain-containing sensor histidine kinase [Verrucomicrobia bacterium]|nr:HAMP domain-containing sensor histidine kinase [Verrucomicrobiota bacterium]
MRISFPLYGKILLWFFLNLVFLGLVFYGFFRVQFRLGLDSLLAGQAGDRIQAVSELIEFDLRRTPRSEWNEVLARFTSVHKVHFFLFRADGVQLAGESVPLPAELAPKINERRGPRPQQPERPRFLRERGGLPPLEGNRRFSTNSLETIPVPPRRPFPDPSLIDETGPVRFPKFMVHTSSPDRYWVGVRIRVSDRGRFAAIPVTLLAMSPSIRGAGLFLDFIPWIVVGTAVIFFSVLFWIPLVRGITRSISQVTRATERIAAGHFDSQVEITRRDELGRLAQAINQMASRLSGFVTGQKRFLGDIAHELCSPIARIQMALGILEHRADPKQKGYVEDVREDVQQMSQLVSELLSFSKASLEPAAITLRIVRVRPIVEQAIQRESLEPSDVSVDVDENLCIQADADLLLRALGNLIRNAIRYAGEAGPITVSAIESSGTAAITVADSGPGVPAESLDQLFDPFYRPELSRNRNFGGVGLGLSIVKTCIESCHGTVSCQNRKPVGFEVSVRLPLANAVPVKDVCVNGETKTERNGP